MPSSKYADVVFFYDVNQLPFQNLIKYCTVVDDNHSQRIVSFKAFLQRYMFL